MMKAHFESIVAGIEGKLAAGGEGPVARKRFALETARLGARLYSGEGVAWCGIFVPFDVLNAMGVTSCFVEFVGAMLAQTGSAGPMLEAAEGEGYAAESCAYHRAVMGAALFGMMPEPDFLIGTSAPCSGGLAVIESLARHFRKDLMVLHVPYGSDEAAVAYFAEQLREMVRFVEERTSRRLEPDRLASAMELTNRTRDALVETYALAAHDPPPARRKDMVNFGIVMPLFFGTEAGVEVAEAYRDELRTRVEAGVAGAPGTGPRLLWLQNRVQFASPIEQVLEEEHGAAVVVDELNDVAWEPIDPRDPFPGLARRALSVRLRGAFEHRAERIRYLARTYRVDGAINPCHWGCRQGTGARGLVEAALREEGVPVLNLEVDCVDQRSFAEGQIRTRIGAFMEMLASK